MDIEVEQAPVTNEPSRQRFEFRADDHIAFLKYEVEGSRINLIHTEVPKELGGRGLGGKLAAFALDYAREHGLRVVPTCPFVAAYIERHPEYQDLVG
jgi:predicted GNAT family acetyltransferase